MENNTILKFDGLSKKFKEKNRSLDTLYQNCGSYLEQISYFNTNAPKLNYWCILRCWVHF